MPRSVLTRFFVPRNLEYASDGLSYHAPTKLLVEIFIAMETATKVTYKIPRTVCIGDCTLQPSILEVWFASSGQTG